MEPVNQDSEGSISSHRAQYGGSMPKNKQVMEKLTLNYRLGGFNYVGKYQFRK